MSPLRPSVRVRVPVILAATAVVGLAGALEAAPRRTATIQTLNRHDAAVVERVRARAAEKLRDPLCRKLLTDFKDRGGRTLEENLQPWGVGAPEYLLLLPFVDGSGERICQRDSVKLAATPGIPRVLVCPARVGAVFSRLGRVEAESPSLAAAMVIHEMLHTLGLGENPPSTFEITDRVRHRCH